MQAAVAGNPADVAALGDVKTADGQTVEAVRKAVIAKLGENMSVRRFERIETAKDRLPTSTAQPPVKACRLNLGAEDVAREVGMRIAGRRSRNAYLPTKLTKS